MKRKFLYALALLLAVSTVAFSNERAAWYRCRTAGTVPYAATTENHVLLHTFIKLLYI